MGQWMNERWMNERWINEGALSHIPTDQHKCKHIKLLKSMSVVRPLSSMTFHTLSSVWAHEDIGRVSVEWIKEHTLSHTTDILKAAHSHPMSNTPKQKWPTSATSLQRDPVTLTSRPLPRPEVCWPPQKSPPTATPAPPQHSQHSRSFCYLWYQA